MDMRSAAIKCFVYATSERVYWDDVRRTTWLLRGLRAWEQATGEDTSHEQASVIKSAGATYAARMLMLHGHARSARTEGV